MIGLDPVSQVGICLAKRAFRDDIDAGAVVSGEKSIEQMGETILDFVVGVASGETHTKAEILGQRDFIPWKRGVSL